MNVGAHRSVLRSLFRQCGALAAGLGRAGKRPLRHASVALALSVAALFALYAATAQAEPPKLISEGLFSTHEMNATGIAVESSGDLFVSSLIAEGLAPSTVVKLDPSGTLLSPPSPFGSAHYSGVAVNPANGDVYVLGEEGGYLTPATPAMIFVYDPNTGGVRAGVVV